MAFQTAMLASEAFALLRSNVPGYKAAAQNALASLQSGSVNTDFIYRSINDAILGAVNALNTWKAVAGLDAYATAQGYSGTMTVDCTAMVTALQACTTWVFNNFPNSGGFAQDYTLNADGSRIARSFTSAQTAGLQTNLAAFIATIG